MNLRIVDLNLLVAFDTLMAERHVTRAALRCGLSQPAMSSTLRRLRRLFDDELLVRTTGGMEPTRRAQELIGPIRTVLQEIGRIVEAERSFDPLVSNRSFNLRMGDLHSAILLPHMVARLERDAPQISLRVVHIPPDKSIAALESGEIDFAISTGLNHPKTIRSKSAYFDRIVCVFRSGHPTAKLPMTIDNFLELRHLKIAQSPTDTRFVDDALARLGLARKVALQVEHWLSAPEIVRNSNLVSIIWETTAGRVSHDGMIFGKLPFATKPFEFKLYWHRRNDGDPAHQWLRQLTLEVCRSAVSRSDGKGRVSR
jgi:DNA-binding transcriptional LysR family regulator